MRPSSIPRRLLRHRGALLGLLVLATVAACALCGPWIDDNDPWAMVQQPFLHPLARSGLPLGTDLLGRDLLAGLLHGARVSLLIGAVSTAAALCAGVLIGGIAGYAGGWTDLVLMRFTELFQSIPGFAFAIVLVSIFEPSLASIVGAIAAVSWPPVARLVRAEFMSLRQRDFILAARLSGRGAWRIAFGDILPNASAPIVVMASMMISTAILLESSLSFLGLGDPNLMSWGYMVGAARTALRDAWWIAVFPGLAIVLTVLALNLVGDGLNDALDTRLEDRTR